MKGKKGPRPVERSAPAAPGRRRTSSITKSGLEAKVEALLAEGLTYKEIAGKIETTEGKKLSKSAVGRFGKYDLIVKTHIRMMNEQAKALVSATDESQALGLEGIGTKLAMTQLLDSILNNRDIPETKLEVMKMIARYNSSSASRERALQTNARLLEIASARFQAEMNKTLAKHPALLKKLNDVYDEVMKSLHEEVK